MPMQQVAASGNSIEILTLFCESSAVPRLRVIAPAGHGTASHDHAQLTYC